MYGDIFPGGFRLWIHFSTHWFTLGIKINKIGSSLLSPENDLKYLKIISKNTHVPVAQLTGEIISKFVKEARTRTES